MGLAPLIVEQMYELVGHLAAEGFALLIVEQFAHTALQYADYAAVMTHGQIRLVGEASDITGWTQIDMTHVTGAGYNAGGENRARAYSSFTAVGNDVYIIGGVCTAGQSTCARYVDKMVWNAGTGTFSFQKMADLVLPGVNYSNNNNNGNTYPYIGTKLHVAAYLPSLGASGRRIVPRR